MIPLSFFSLGCAAGHPWVPRTRCAPCPWAHGGAMAPSQVWRARAAVGN